MDMALTLAAAEAGEPEAQALQLVIEYDPQPPFHAGATTNADPTLRQRATELVMEQRPKLATLTGHLGTK